MSAWQRRRAPTVIVREPYGTNFGKFRGRPGAIQTYQQGLCPEKRCLSRIRPPRLWYGWWEPLDVFFGSSLDANGIDAGSEIGRMNCLWCHNDSKLESYDSEFSELPSCLLINLAAFEIKKIPIIRFFSIWYVENASAWDKEAVELVQRCQRMAKRHPSRRWVFKH